jgi:peptidoglycan/xylan/chitin deacetylase (PgdA/CDA1 family)
MGFEITVRTCNVCAMTQKIPILTFHSLDNDGSVISFPSHLFRRGLTRLHEQGYTTVSLPKAAESIRRRAPLPERALVITFDDGFESIYREALPVLLDCRMTATVFIIAGTAQSADKSVPYLGRSTLTWRQIREMRQCGLDIGSHTLTHPDLTKLSQDRLEAEIRDSKKVIEDHSGGPVYTFAYPSGRYDERSRQVVGQTFDCACSVRLGIASSVSDHYALERVDAYYLRNEKTFDLMLGRFFPAYIWTRKVPRTIRHLLWSGR